MSSIADLARPSWILLFAVSVANVALAVAHWGAVEASPVLDDARVPVASIERRSAQGPPPVIVPETVAQPEQTAVQTTVPLAPLPAPVDRVALRRETPICRAWGPFTALEDAEALARRLALPGESFEVFQAEVATDPDYLVTVRAPAEREVVDRMLAELKSRKIDSYILERGPEGNVLAVGVFSVAGGAERRQRRLTELGYQADLEPLPRSHRIYHLLARVPADQEPEVPAAGGCGDIAPMQQFL